MAFSAISKWSRARKMFICKYSDDACAWWVINVCNKLAELVKWLGQVRPVGICVQNVYKTAIFLQHHLYLAWTWDKNFVILYQNCHFEECIFDVFDTFFFKFNRDYLKTWLVRDCYVPWNCVISSAGKRQSNSKLQNISLQAYCTQRPAIRSS